MTNGVNLTAVYIANIMGLLIMLIMGLGIQWRRNVKNRENRLLLGMIIITACACITDPLVFTLDGKPGLLNFAIVYGGNLLLYILIILLGMFWISLVSQHVYGELQRSCIAFISTVAVISTVILILNFFFPLVFVVDKNNVYYREGIYWLYTLMQSFMILDGLVICITARFKGGILKFFPVWQFIIPVSLGAILQTFCYGISVIFPLISISICGVVISLQNELMFRDKLTGVYNRFYLDIIKKNIESKKNGNITAIMLDVNGFKKINDTYGHDIGDEALIKIADICTRAVGNLGTVIRYAGDEFIILLNTTNNRLIELCIRDVHLGCENHNNRATASYTLSIALGCSKLDLKGKSVEDLLREVDKRMYEEKRRYYMTHDRRKRDNNDKILGSERKNELCQTEKMTVNQG